MQHTNRSLVGQGSTTYTIYRELGVRWLPGSHCSTGRYRVYLVERRRRTTSEKRSPLLHMAINLDAKKIRNKSQWQIKVKPRALECLAVSAQIEMPGGEKTLFNAGAAPGNADPLRVGYIHNRVSFNVYSYSTTAPSTVGAGVWFSPHAAARRPRRRPRGAPARTPRPGGGQPTPVCSMLCKLNPFGSGACCCLS